MPTVTLSLLSQRGKPATDRVVGLSVRGHHSGPMHPADIVLRPGEIVLDAVPDRYEIGVEVGGFLRAQTTLDVGFTAVARVLRVEHVCTTMPKVSQLGKEPRRLLETLDSTKKPGEIWDDLTDNKAATFFQVTHALSGIPVDGQPLSAAIDRIVRLGGFELTAPDTAGVSKTVVGWRMHVTFVGGQDVESLLGDAGFKRDGGVAHPTHKRFGFTRSFREKAGSPRMQIVVNHEGSSADVDLDAGAFHKSSPHDIRKGFAKRFPETSAIYVVQ